MKRGKTFPTFSVTWIIALLFVLSGTNQSFAQCNVKVSFNGVEITNGGSLDYILGPGECCISLSMLQSAILDDLSCATCGDPLMGASVTVAISNGGVIGLPGILDLNALLQEVCLDVDPLTGVVSPSVVTVSIANYDDCGGGGLTYSGSINVNPYPNSITALACNDNVQLSLNENCEATVTPDMILEGGPYKCWDAYTVEVRNGGPNGPIVDRSPAPGTQLDRNDFGNCYTTRVYDPETGNNCWGQICIEDKLPPVFICSLRPVIVPCGTDLSPDSIGRPSVGDACGNFTLTYKDEEEELECDDQRGFGLIVTRTWTATDASGNTSTCVQNIWVQRGNIGGVGIPEDRDDITLPAFECHEKLDPNKDVSSHFLNSPFCVDGYLLDSAHWVATGGTPLGGDLSGQRRPKILGWNCIQSGPYAGHPAPGDIYYEEHPNWSLFSGCWGPDTHVKWEGSGYPTGVDCSNINYTFSDTRIDVSDPNCDAGEVGCYKILRKWVILDWCTGDILEEFQVIKVLDKQGPEITYPDEINVGMTSSSCTGIWPVTPPWITDNCSNEVHYTLRTSAGTVLGNEINGFTVIDLPQGMHTGYIEASDCCGNTSIHEIKINVIDDVPPTAICDAHTVLSLSGSSVVKGINTTELCASVLDDGSYDNCNDVYFKIIRMDDLLGTVNGSFADNTASCEGASGDDAPFVAGNQVYFDDCAHFCCEDVGQSIMVVLRVFDVDPGAGPVSPNRMNPGGRLSGRFSDCMVEVIVQDKSTPIVVAPPDMVVSCMFWFDDSEDALTDPDNSTFGRVVTDLAWRQKVKTTDKVCEYYCISNSKTGYLPSTVQNGLACDYYNDLYDPAHPDNLYELTWGFDGYVLSTCGTDFDIRIIDERECGQGLIIREVVVTRGNVTFRARQRIYVIDCDPFYIGEDCNDPDDDIIWPLFCRQPDVIEGCGADTSPDNPELGRPQIDNGGDDNCALIIIDYKDEVFTIEPDACFKILRTWVVIDWCRYDPVNGDEDGRWEYVQVIKVNDGDDPVVQCLIGDCEPAEKNPLDQTCYGHISLTVDVEDECTPDSWLNYEYKIDIDNDGNYDAYSGPAKPGSVPFKFDNPYADDEKNSTDASGVYPIGEHRITWFIEDGCGNVGTCDTTFVIKDCKRPTPYCKTGIITVVMPSSGAITVWANDLDAGSFDNCTLQEDLKFYFNGDSTWTGYVINCDSFKAAGVTGKIRVEVEMWVEDEEGNADFCKTIIEVQDPNMVCEGTLPAAIAGKVFTERREYVQDVEVDLMKNNIKMTDRRTNDDGYYAFMNLDRNENYTVNPIKDDNYINGVSTADLVSIRRHLLGNGDLSSPYKRIAADANNSETISAADISLLRKLVLGLITELPDVDSWRFVPQTFAFEDVRNPWFNGGFPEKVDYNNLNAQMMNTDFVAIKVGDVTGDVDVNGLNGLKTRSGDQFEFVVNEMDFVANQTIELNINAEDLSDISGYQFTLEYDQTKVEFEGFTSGAIILTDDNFGYIEDGMVTTSWNDFGYDMGEGTAFTLKFRALGAGKLSEAVAFTSALTKAEAYSQDLEPMDVVLTFRGDAGQTLETFELLQNVPNPFENETVIGFNLPEQVKATITIYDVVGKVLNVIPVQGQKGYNEIVVSTANLGSTGVMYYQLDAGQYTATKKMLSVN